MVDLQFIKTVFSKLKPHGYSRMVRFVLKYSWFYISILVICAIIGVQMSGFHVWYLSYTQYASGLTVAVSFVAVAVLFAYSFITLPRFSKKDYALTMALLIGAAVAVHYFIAHALLSSGYSWDVQTISNIAHNYQMSGTTNTSDWIGTYLAKYDNNIAVTFILTTWLSLCSFFFGSLHSIVYIQILNSLVILTTFIVLIYIANNLYGRRYAMVAYVLGLILVVMSAYTPIFYTDTLGGLFVMLVLLGFVMTKSSIGMKNKLYWLIFAGFTTSVGYLIKPTVMIIGLAIVAAVAIAYYTNKTKKNFLLPSLFYSGGIIAGMIVCTLVFLAVPNFAKYSRQEIELNKSPMLHFLALGSLRGLPPYTECRTGNYCGPFVDYVQSGDPGVDTISEREEYSLRLIKASIVTDFPKGYMTFLAKKTLANYSDGTFGVWREGVNNGIVFYNNNQIDRLLRDLFGPTGTMRAHLSSLQHIVWVSVLLIISLGALVLTFLGIFKRGIWEDSFFLSIVGISIFLALFEGRARYMFLYVPVFILAAVAVLHSASRYSKGRTHRMVE